MPEPTSMNEQDLFDACVGLPGPEQSAALERACDDPLLRQRVERLLAAHARAERATLQPLEALALGVMPDVIGPYELRGLLGEGGMGVVYEAEQRHPVRRQVALKIVKLGMDTRQVVQRFMAERQALAAMDHPFVAKVFDAGETAAGRPYFVMELVRGEPLLDYCTRARSSIRQRVELFILICQAVQHAHQKGVIHRDLKPSNLLVSPSDAGPIPKVIDFGIAKAVGGDTEPVTQVTRGGQALGTPAYMSPEQAGHGIDVDTRSDVYSLGVILYELLTASLPTDPAAIGEARFLARLSSGELDPPAPGARTAGAERIADDLDRIVMKALHVDRARRYETAAALADDLARYLNEQPVTARPPTLSYRARKFVRRHRVQVAAAALAGVALVGGASAAGIGMVRASRAEASARQEATTARRVSEFLTGLFGASDPNARSSTTLRELLDRAAARIEPELHDQPKAQASLLETISHVYGSLGLHRDAATLAEKSLKLADAGEETVHSSEAALTLGRSLQALGEFGRAREAFERALAIRLRLVGESDIGVAAILNNLGGLHSQLERFDESIAAHTRALAIQERLRGPESVQVTNSLRGLGIVYSRQKQYERALALNLRTLAIYQKTYGDDHPVTAGGFENVAWDLKDLDRLAEARPHAERALEIRRHTIGLDHPQIAFSHALLGELQEAAGDLHGAHASFQEALRIREASLGSDNPRTGDVLERLGMLKLRLGAVHEGHQLLERTLRIFEKAYGPNHSKTVASRQHVATALDRMKGGPARAASRSQD